MLYFNDDELRCLIAALNFTKHRTIGSSWEDRDEAILIKLLHEFDDRIVGIEYGICPPASS